MPQAYTAETVFDGEQALTGHALVADGGLVSAVCPLDAVPKGTAIKDLGPGWLAPGFVDLQVNGGGGVMFNDAPSVETLRTIADAHARLGTTALLPTLITDTPAVVTAAISAVSDAVRQGVPGIAGLHLEGPHLSVARKGAHDAALIRPMTDDDQAELCQAARTLPALMLTVAPETVTPAQIETLANAGAVVSLGHSDADYVTCVAAIGAGARCATHLFNAMSQLAGRAPGLVGASLTCGELSTGLIADGIHVHPATIRAALAAKQGPGRVFLVTDAMATAGSDIAGFHLNGRWIGRADGRLTLADGTLAGADLAMAQALRVLVDQVGIGAEQALSMATGVPGAIIGQSGVLRAGGPADFVHLSPDLSLNAVWRAGQPVA